MVLTAIALLLVSRQQAPGRRVSEAIPGGPSFQSQVPGVAALTRATLRYSHLAN